MAENISHSLENLPDGEKNEEVCKSNNEHASSNNTEKSALIPLENNRKSLQKSMDLRQKLLLFDIVFIEFLISGCFAVSYAFFARVVVKKGGNVFYSSFILQTALACFTIGSFVFGHWQHKIGKGRLFYSGLLATGVFQIAFGCLEFVDNIQIFIVLGVIFKALSGFGMAAYSVAAYTTISVEYTDHVSQIMGLCNTAMGCARFVAPAFGGYLYDIIGMFLPIAIWGAMPIITFPIHYFLFKGKRTDTSQEREQSESIKKFLLKSSTIATLAMLFTVYGILTYVDVVLTVYFQAQGLSVTMAGLGTLCIGGFLALTGPICGCLAGKRSWTSHTIIISGALLLSGTLMLFTPEQTTAIVYIGCVLFGITCSMILVPVFEVLLKIAEGGDEIPQNLYGKISSIFIGVSGLGVAIVPIGFSAIQTATNSSVSIMLYSLSGVLLFVTLFLLISKIQESRKQK